MVALVEVIDTSNAIPTVGPVAALWQQTQSLLRGRVHIFPIFTANRKDFSSYLHFLWRS